MKLLFDENLSPRLVGALASLYQESQHGAPRKVVWLAVGNVRTQTIATLLAKHSMAIDAFRSSPEESLLILP